MPEDLTLATVRVEEGGTLTDDFSTPLYLKQIGGGEDVLFGHMLVINNVAWVEVVHNSRLLWDGPSVAQEGIYKRGDVITLRIDYFSFLECQLLPDETKET